MGAWGEDSCSNDTCWDILGYYTKNIHEMTQAEVDKISAGLFKNVHFEETYNRTVDCQHGKLGCVVWALTHGFAVKKPALKKAIKIAKDLLENKEFLSTWVSHVDKVGSLREELADMNEALAGDGKIPPRHVVGLMEKMSKALSH